MVYMQLKISSQLQQMSVKILKSITVTLFKIKKMEKCEEMEKLKHRFAFLSEI